MKPRFEKQFTVYAVARRSRWETDATKGHSLEEESRDIMAVLQAIGDPVSRLGHSYGAQVALAAAATVPDRVRTLVLYEPPWPCAITDEALARLAALARAGDGGGFAVTFFRDTLRVPRDEVDRLRTTAAWAPILADAEVSLGDLRALYRYDFTAERFPDLRVPVQLQFGTESPRDLYVTDALAVVLPALRGEAFPGQAHEGMTTAPTMYADAVARVLLA